MITVASAGVPVNRQTFGDNRVIGKSGLAGDVRCKVKFWR